jgi:hypothetical protein
MSPQCTPGAAAGQPSGPGNTDHYSESACAIRVNHWQYIFLVTVTVPLVRVAAARVTRVRQILLLQPERARPNRFRVKPSKRNR